MLYDDMFDPAEEIHNLKIAIREAMTHSDSFDSYNI